MDWFLYRVLTDERCRVSWSDLLNMTVLDVQDMHEALDLRDELARKSALAAEREREA